MAATKYINGVGYTNQITGVSQSPACQFSYTYTATLANGDPLPTFLSLTGDTFSIASTTTSSDMNTYDITVTASIIDDAGTKSGTFNW